ncbi:MAG: PKD domain-containing protein, partial [Cytophagaceae bacterium]|nr:PKD domain-containing protein [Cytophagaceae bacterium]
GEAVPEGLTWQWDFGDGSTAGTTDATHSYTTAGTYTVTLTGGDAGITDTFTFKVTVLPSPVFTLAPAVSGCESVDLLQLEPQTGSIEGLTIQYFDANGDECSAAVTVSGTYYITGTDDATGCSHTVAVEVEINPLPVISGITTTMLPAPAPLYTFEFEAGVTGNITGWLWDFGGGITSSAEKPQHQYVVTGAQTVELTVTTDKNCEATHSSTFEIQYLDAAFETDIEQQCLEGNQFTFTNTSTLNGETVPEGLTWQWDFGDGSTAGTTDATHSYTTAGTYTVTLTGGDADLTDKYTVAVTVIEMPEVNDVDNFLLCNGTQVPEYVFTGNPAAKVEYRWEKTGGDSIEGLPLSGIDAIPAFTATNTTGNILVANYRVTPVSTAETACVGIAGTFTIRILPKAAVVLTNDTVNSCQSDSFFELYFEGDNTSHFYAVMFDEAALNEGYSNIAFAELAGNTVRIPQPAGVAEGVYNGKLLVGFDGCNITDTIDFRVIVSTLPNIVSQPVSTLVCEGMEFSLTVLAQGENLAYQWYKDGVEIAGAVAGTYSVPAVQVNDSVAGKYYVEVISHCGIVQSSEITINRVGSFSILAKWGEPVLFVSNRNSAGEIVGYTSYQWYKDDRIIDNAVYQYYKVQEGDEGVFVVRAFRADESYAESCPLYFGVSNSNEQKTISIYPNPVRTSNLLQVENLSPENSDSEITLELYDMTGRLIEKRKTLFPAKVEITLLPNVYILQLSDNSGILKTEKIAVTR